MTDRNQPMKRIGLGTAPLAFKDVTTQQAVATVHAALDCGVERHRVVRHPVPRALVNQPGRRMRKACVGAGANMSED
ncbi:hypothetical protein [Paractinoplanes hotanensis]|uniref:Uncharacterized protein n=1 Tax=Paractinoplanes hotanensis TaxID=2906497 RepID=A0ABT0YB91_9ACTN|nr:hypothetical protein [Actinoplanes hotanensis]MCM4083070.1 hypothetical protein [Actinoplanes hotanensis]